MLEHLTRWIQPLVPIRREEWRKTILMFFYFFFTLATLYILKPIQRSLFLTTYGAQNLRYAYLGEGIFLILVTLAYVDLNRWIPKKRTLFSVATASYIVSIIAFWFMFRGSQVKWIAFLFYVWVASYSITFVTQFWLMASDIFNPQEAKRLFGFILSGGSLGGIVGGLVANQAAHRVGTENLLILSALLLSGCLVLIQLIWRSGGHAEIASEEMKVLSKRSEGLPERATWSLFFKHRYLLLITALVMVTKVASTLIDNQFNWTVEHHILEKNAQTAFFGGFMAFLNAVSLVMQLIVAKFVLRRFGVGTALMLLPIGLCFGSIATIFFPLLLVSGITKVFDGSMNYSISQISKEILYLPIPSYLRYRVKPLIDMLGFRLSKSLAGFLIILVTPLLGITDDRLGIMVVFLIPFWILAVWGVRDGYVQAIKALLSKTEDEERADRSGTEELAETISDLGGERSFDRLQALLAHRSSIARKISAAACFAFYHSAHDIHCVRRLVMEMMREEALELKKIVPNFSVLEKMPQHVGVLDKYLVDLLKAERHSGLDLRTFLEREERRILLKISEFLNSEHEEMNHKRKAVLILTLLGTQGAVDILLDSLSSARDCSLRFGIIRALNRIRAKNEGRVFHDWILKKEILREVENYQTLAALLQEYRHRHRNTAHPEEDYLLAILEAMGEESFERVFRLLALLYDSGVIHIVHDRLSDADLNDYVRANAMELLENIVEIELFKKLAPVLDREKKWKLSQEQFETTLRDFLVGGDRWLGITAIFMIATLEIQNLYFLIEESKHSQSNIVQEAAAIAFLKIAQPK